MAEGKHPSSNQTGPPAQEDDGIMNATINKCNKE